MNEDFRFDNYDRPKMNVFNNIYMGQNKMQTTNSNPNLAEPYEGFLRGNLFNNLYQQYMNYRPAQLIPNNEQAELLLNVNQLTFAVHELNLYLDVYPNDRNMISLFNTYQKIANEAIEKYEKAYGPLTINHPSNSDTFSWQAYSWPWEMGEM